MFSENLQQPSRKGIKMEKEDKDSHAHTLWQILRSEARSAFTEWWILPERTQ